ncbi:HNH endonuclease [Clostridium tagluense]|uniref:HNH endonuclease n=1 Tax=Clostridium tagluense TaxID=360422 RepID=UPI001CF15EA8|nr:HNH endonuclease [Clostridium tagluense]MCB2313626.1 HNH endonuclease [Clostridium tagluense]MCB2318473.1 HNH endonuclease [Clostridium tagluense]MCB2323291.1 HNH endonuclease [Clostridium tagluense]MCB2328234.1 HNH endonuclease [Clostridium tagluense]MCB2332993.1 HNH endonuclease [Clostridium tagluense]
MLNIAIKYFTKTDLIQANNAAIRENRNRQLKKEFLESLSAEGLYPISYHIYHTKDEVRVNILFDSKGTCGFLDMSSYRYELLPISIKNKDGIYENEDPIITASKRPYPNEREWSEKVIRQPVRKQGKFRKEVLEAYGSQCAVCNINNPSLLRAAHITPAVDDNDDTVNNGICLCVLHEVAFDRGVLQIAPNGEITIAGDEDINVDVTNLRFPADNECYPSYENLKQRFEKST